MPSTALIPMPVIDSPVLDLIRELSTSVFKPSVADLKATVKKLSICRALGVLETLGYSNDEILLGGTTKSIWWLFNGNVSRLACESAPFLFWGGPPNKLDWYEGTLETLVSDRILSEIDLNGFEYVYEKIKSLL
jgi:hypothetical protein